MAKANDMHSATTAAEVNLAAALALHASLADAPASVRADALRCVLSARAELAKARALKAMAIVTTGGAS